MNMRSPMADLSGDFTATYGLLIAERAWRTTLLRPSLL